MGLFDRVLFGSPNPCINTPGNPRPYAWTALNAGPVQPVISPLHACWLKLNRPGKFRSNLALPLTQLKSAPTLIVCRPVAHVTLSRIWLRFSVRLTGEKGLEPINPVPA